MSTRRKFLKKGLGYTIALSGVAPILAACGSTSASSSTSSTVTLSMWFNHPEWLSPVKQLVAQFEKENPGIHIDLTAKPGPSYPTLISSALAAHSAPDIFGMQAGGQYITIAKSKELHDLTGKLHLSALNEAAQQVLPVKGHIYGVPLLGEYTIGIYYWKAPFVKYGLTPPHTWNELMHVCQVLKSHGEVPLVMPSQDGVIPTFFYTALVTSVKGPKGVTELVNGQAKLTDPEFVQAAALMKNLVPYYNPGYIAVPYLNGKALFAEGKGIMLEGGSADYTGFKQVNPSITSKDLGFFAVPHPSTSGARVVCSGTDLIYGLNSSVKSPEKVKAAITFLNWWLTPTVGSQVGQKIEMPEVVGAKVIAPMFQRIVEQSTHSAAVWYEFPQLSNMWTYSTENIQKLLLGTWSPQQFSAALQGQIT